MTRDWWQTDPTYVIDDPPKGFECPPIFDFCWTNDASPWTMVNMNNACSRVICQLTLSLIVLSGFRSSDELPLLRADLYRYGHGGHPGEGEVRRQTPELPGETSRVLLHCPGYPDWVSLINSLVQS